VNGVNFQAFPTTGGNGGPALSGGVTFATSGAGGVFESNTGGASPNAPFSNLPAGYQTILSSYTVPLFGPVTLTMSGLTLGGQYQFEFWSNNSNDMFSYGITAAAGNSVTLASNNGHANGGLGEWVLGSFTADAATQSISFVGDGDGGFLNAFQLRQAAAGVPDAGATLMLLGLSLGGIAVLRWRTGVCSITN
jgi:hypothetical protein